MDRFTCLAGNNTEVVRVTPDGKVFVRRGDDLIDTGVTMPTPLPEPSTNYTFTVMHKIALALADLRAALAAWETNFKRQSVMLKNCDEMLKDANAELATARREERERCAKTAEIWDSEPLSGNSIAQEIRALTDTDAASTARREE